MIDTLVYYGCPALLVLSYVIAAFFWFFVPKEVCAKAVTPIILLVLIPWFIGAITMTERFMKHTTLTIPFLDWIVIAGLFAPFVFPNVSAKWEPDEKSTKN